MTLSRRKEHEIKGKIDGGIKKNPPGIPGGLKY
jgi:hypothetical protein